MNLATLKEEELFYLIKNNLIPDLEKTEKVSRWDGYSENLSMAIELKCRRKSYLDVLIEKDKYIYLKLFNNCRYIISDPSGIYSFNINNIDDNDMSWYEHQMPATTEFENTNTITKLVGYIPKVYSINITNKLTNETSNRKI
jgi:hypothetical protein